MEHAVVGVLASAAGEREAYPGLLSAIGESLGCAGAMWLPGEDDSFHCVETWPAGAAIGAALVASAASGRPVSADGTFAFPLRGVGVMAFATTGPLALDDALLATLESLGTQISVFVERCRAVQAVQASEARKTAILNAAFDSIITMDHLGNVVEVNRAAERTFGYRADEMIGRELAALIVPPSLRAAHRRGVRKYLETGATSIAYHPLELEGMRKDGSEFPCEVVITRADLPGPPLFCGYLRDVTEARERERDQRRLVEEQAALRRVATAVAEGSRDPAAGVRGRHRGGRAAARRAELEHGALRRGRDGDRRGWVERGAGQQHPGGRDGADGRRHRIGARVPDGRAGADRELRRARRGARRVIALAGLPERRRRRRSSSKVACGAR